MCLWTFHSVSTDNRAINMKVLNSLTVHQCTGESNWWKYPSIAMSCHSRSSKIESSWFFTFFFLAPNMKETCKIFYVKFQHASLCTVALSIRWSACNRSCGQPTANVTSIGRRMNVKRWPSMLQELYFLTFKLLIYITAHSAHSAAWWPLKKVSITLLESSNLSFLENSRVRFSADYAFEKDHHCRITF